MEKLVTRLLQKYLRVFLKGFKHGDLQLKFLKGETNLRNLDLNEECLRELLGLPQLEVANAKVSRIFLKVPFKKPKHIPLSVCLDRITVELREPAILSPIPSTYKKQLGIPDPELDELERAVEGTQAKKGKKEKRYGFLQKMVDGMRVEVASVRLLIHTLGKAKCSESHPYLPPALEILLHDVSFSQCYADWQEADNLRLARKFCKGSPVVVVFKKLVCQRGEIAVIKRAEQGDPQRVVITSDLSLNARITIKKKRRGGALLDVGVAVEIPPVVTCLSPEELVTVWKSLEGIKYCLGRLDLPNDRQSTTSEPLPDAVPDIGSGSKESKGRLQLVKKWAFRGSAKKKARSLEELRYPDHDFGERESVPDDDIEREDVVGNSDSEDGTVRHASLVTSISSDISSLPQAPVALEIVVPNLSFEAVDGVNVLAKVEVTGTKVNVSDLKADELRAAISIEAGRLVTVECGPIVVSPLWSKDGSAPAGENRPPFLSGTVVMCHSGVPSGFDNLMEGEEEKGTRRPLTEQVPCVGAKLSCSWGQVTMDAPALAPLLEYILRVRELATEWGVEPSSEAHLPPYDKATGLLLDMDMAGWTFCLWPRDQVDCLTVTFSEMQCALRIKTDVGVCKASLARVEASVVGEPHAKARTLLLCHGSSEGNVGFLELLVSGARDSSKKDTSIVARGNAVLCGIELEVSVVDYVQLLQAVEVFLAKLPLPLVPVPAADGRSKPVNTVVDGVLDHISNAFGRCVVSTELEVRDTKVALAHMALLDTTGVGAVGSVRWLALTSPMIGASGEVNQNGQHVHASLMMDSVCVSPHTGGAVQPSWQSHALCEPLCGQATVNCEKGEHVWAIDCQMSASPMNVRADADAVSTILAWLDGAKSAFASRKSIDVQNLVVTSKIEGSRTPVSQVLRELQERVVILKNRWVEVKEEGMMNAVKTEMEELSVALAAMREQIESGAAYQHAGQRNEPVPTGDSKVEGKRGNDSIVLLL